MVLTHLAWVCIGLLSMAPPYLAEPNIYSHLSSTSVLPSPVKYFKQDGDQVAMETEPSAVAQPPDNRVDTADRAQQPRLGYPLYSSTSLNTGYSGSSPGVYSPVKLDLGGLLLGTVVGLGAVLLIPKILHIFSTTGHSSYSHYARDGDSVTTGMTDIIARVDKAMSAQHVNTSSCLQRAFCALVQYSSDNDQTDNFISAATRNPVVSFLMDGSPLKEAVTAGQSGHSCSTSYPQCPITPEIVATGLQAALQSL